MTSRKPRSASRKPKAGVSPLLAGMMGQPPVTGAAVAADTVAGWHPDYLRAVALQQKEEIGQALVVMEAQAARWPEEPDVQNLTAVLLAQHRRFDEAIAAWKKVLQADPHNVNVLSNLGRACERMGQHAQSLAYLEDALRHDPVHQDALLNIGVTLQNMGRLEQALQHFRRLLELHPGHVQCLFNIATVQQHQLDFAAAHATYQQVLACSPGHIDAQANLIFTQHYVMPQEPENIARRARVLGQAYAALHVPYRDWPVTPQAGRRLRIGLVSADLRDHPVGYFLEGLLGSGAASGFDWVAYANSHVVSALMQRIQPRFSRWHTVYTWSDDQLARQIRADQVDVLIDLSGYTAGHRLGVFARRPAPVQITWLGYWGTTGIPAMTAVLADPHCVPPHEEHWFSEKVWRLPNSRYCFQPPQDAPAPGPLPAQQRGHITFGCFQELAKINDTVLALWGRIAQQLPDAHWRIQSTRLGEASPDRTQLLQRMRKAGIAGEQIALHGPMPRAEYLRAYGEVDVLLDTFCYPGGTTTAEALWMGVPTVTLATPGMLGRQGQQVMSAAGLAPWVCHSQQQYADMAVQLGHPSSWQVLGQLRQALRHHLPSTMLFHQEQFARDWAGTIQQIWREACASGWPVSPA